MRTLPVSEYRQKIKGESLNSAVRRLRYYSNKKELLAVVDSVFKEELARRARVQQWLIAVRETEGGATALADVLGIERAVQVDMRRDIHHPSNSWDVAERAMLAAEGAPKAAFNKKEKNAELHVRLKQAAASAHRTLGQWCEEQGLSKWLPTTTCNGNASEATLIKLEAALDAAGAPKAVVKEPEPPVPPPAQTVTLSVADMAAMFKASQDADMLVVMAALAALKKKFDGKTEGAMQLLERMQAYGIPLSVLGGGG